MAIPVIGRFTVFDAIAVTTTQEFHAITGNNNQPYVASVILEVVGASSPNWSLAIQGKTHPSGTYTAVDYQQIWQGGAAALTNGALSVTDTTRRFYVIPNAPQFLQIVATRTAGTLTVYASLTSQVFAQWLLTTARGSIYTEGPTADGSAAAGNPVLTAGEADDATVKTLRTDLDGVAYVKDIVPAPQSEVVAIPVTGTMTTAIQLTALDFLTSQVSVVFRNRNTDAEGLVGDVAAQTLELKKGEPLMLGTADPRTVYLKAHTTAADDADGLLTLVDRPAFRGLLRRLTYQYGGWYLPCNERSGTAIVDAGRMQADFLLTGATLVRPGVFGLGIDYDQTGDYLRQKSEAVNAGVVTVVETNGSATIDDASAPFTAAIRDGKHYLIAKDTSNRVIHGYIGTADVDGDSTKVNIYSTAARATQNWVEGGSTAFDPAGTPTFTAHKEAGFTPTSGATWGAWIQADQLNQNQRILMRTEAVQPVSGYRSSFVMVLLTTGLLDIEVESGGTATVANTGTNTLKIGRWHFVVGVYSPSTYLRGYVDGVLDKENTTSIPASVDDAAAVWSIGAQNVLGTPNLLFDGRISYPFYLPTALDANMIRTLFELSRR